MSTDHTPGHDGVRRLQNGTYIADELRVLGFLGSGGSSDVYKCEDEVLSRIVAVKTLREGYSEDALRRLQTEGKAIARLEHPNIVKLFGLRTSLDSLPLLVMEFVDGVSLAELLKTEKTLSVARSLRIVLQIVEGLRAAQKQDIIHRDLKPANIMVVKAGTAEEHVEILDFGLAKMQNDVSTKATQTGTIVGTPQYMSPEQALGKKCDGRSDQYSLGCILFEMLCGRPPFEYDNLVSIVIAHAQEQAPPLSKYVKEPMPAGLQTLVTKLLQKNPEDRFESMYDVGLALIAATTRKSQPVGRSVGIALGVLAIAGAIAVVCLHGPGHRDAGSQPTASKTVHSKPAPRRPLELTEADKEIIRNADKYIQYGGSSLEVKNEGLTDAGLIWFVRHQKFQYICVRKCRGITSESMSSLIGQPLAVLDVAGTSVDDSAAESLKQMIHLRNLVLKDLPVTATTISSIVSLPLKELFLSDDTVDARSLSAISNIKSLWLLDLEESEITGKVKFLKDSNVEDLILSHNRLTDDDFDDGLLKMKHLHALRMDGTNISSDQLMKLSRIKELDHISLNGCGELKDTDFVAFHKRAPLCWIEEDRGVDRNAIRQRVDASQLTGPELVSNGDFEQGSTPRLHQLCQSGTSFTPDWKVAEGVIDWVNKTVRTPASGANSVCLAGNVYGKIVQTLSTTPGVRYCVRFKAAPKPGSGSRKNQGVEVRVGRNSLRYILPIEDNSDKNMGWEEYVWTFRATEAKSDLEFRDIAADAPGACIDKVSVRKLIER